MCTGMYDQFKYPQVWQYIRLKFIGVSFYFFLIQDIERHLQSLLDNMGLKFSNKPHQLYWDLTDLIVKLGLCNTKQNFMFLKKYSRRSYDKL